MDILQYVKYVFIVIDIIVLLTLAINLLKGFFQGFFRYLFTSGLKWIIIVILILFSKQIAQELLTIDIPQIGRLDNYLVSVICDLLKMDQSTLVNTYTYELIYTVVLSTIRLSVILISVFLTNLIIWPIISLVLTIFGINALIKKLPKSLTHRILGLVLSIVVFLVIFVVTYLPYYGLINLVTYGLEDSKLIVSNEPQIEEVSELNME